MGFYLSSDFLVSFYYYLIVQPFDPWLSIKFAYCFSCHLKVPEASNFSSHTCSFFQHFPAIPLGDGWRHVTTDCLSNRQGKIHLPCMNKIYSYLNGRHWHTEMQLWTYFEAEAALRNRLPSLWAKQERGCCWRRRRGGDSLHQLLAEKRVRLFTVQNIP